jgi:hypothetical protein
MAGGYVAAVIKHLWPTQLVFDRFHVVELMNEKLTMLRRELYRWVVRISSGYPWAALFATVSARRSGPQFVGTSYQTAKSSADGPMQRMGERGLADESLQRSAGCETSQRSRDRPNALGP